MHVSEDTLVQWMNFIRYGLSGGLVHTNRFLECFWDSQLKSKRWVVDNFPDEEHETCFYFRWVVWNNEIICWMTTK